MVAEDNKLHTRTGCSVKVAGVTLTARPCLDTGQIEVTSEGELRVEPGVGLRILEIARKNLIKRVRRFYGL